MATVVKYPYEYESFIICKHYPKCDGSVIDMIESEE